PVGLVDMDYPKPGRFGSPYFEAADRHVGVGFDVLLEHKLVIHLVDVIAGEHDHVTRRVPFDDVDVLIDGVGRAGVPGRIGYALACRQDVEALIALLAEKIPATLEMANQAVRLI